MVRAVTYARRLRDHHPLLVQHLRPRCDAAVVSLCHQLSLSSSGWSHLTSGVTRESGQDRLSDSVIGNWELRESEQDSRGAVWQSGVTGESGQDSMERISKGLGHRPNKTAGERFGVWDTAMTER